MLRITDTAGIRHTTDVVEKEGVARSRRALQEAELVLLVLDGSQPLDEEDLRLMGEAAPESTLAVINKQDLLGEAPPPWEDQLAGLPHVAMSARTGAGLEALEQAIAQWALRGDRPLSEIAMITNLRQKQSAEQAKAALDAAAEGLAEGLGEELVAVDVQRALDALGDIVGETTADDLLERIFAEFCIGK